MTINWKKILFGISDEKLDPYFHLERSEEYILVEVKEALAKAELPEALHLLSTLPSAAIEPHAIALSARYHRLEEEQLQGILNYQDYQIGLNRLTFLREMDARHFFESPGGSWRFRHKILQDYFIQEYERMEREGVFPKYS